MLEQLGQYKILDRIGSGGLGEVYRARDTRLGRTVAIKVLPRALVDDPDRNERFLREARAAAVLSHPNIAALYEIGEENGQLFLAFEFVPGEPLSRIIAGRPLNPRRAVQFAAQVADGLADAHAAGIVHRDVRPDNIVITPKGNAKLLDFGLARWTAGGAAREQAGHGATRASGAALGTLAYMSPEQARGDAVDARTDIFSLGIALYEMLTGSRPFQGATAAALVLQVVEKPVPPPSTVNRGVSKGLDEVVARALEKDPAARFASAATLAAELRAVDREIQDAPVRTGVVAVAPAAVTRPRPSRTGWIVAIVALVAISGAGGLWYERDALASFWRGTISKAAQPTIAVIPLELAGSEAESRSAQSAEANQDRYFADGLTEDLITRLGQTPGIKVLGRSAIRDYRGRSPADLARELRAGVVLTGTIRSQDHSMKLSLELIDPTNGVALWDNQYSRDLKDIFAVQAQVAEDVARALRLKLQPTAASERAAQRIVDRRAYDFYLRGRQATAQRQLGAAKDQFAQAIAVDDGLAEAHAGLAEVLHLEAVFGAADDPARRSRLKSAAERAYELAPDLPQANLAKALASDSFDAALGYLKRAIAFDASYSEAFHQIGDQIQAFDPERAISFYRQALALDPRMDINHADITSCLSTLGRFDEAHAELEASTGRSDWKTPVRVALDLDQGHYDQALQALEHGNLMREAPMFALSYVTVLRMVNRRDDALREAMRLTQVQPASCEARAALAGLRAERGQLAQATQLITPALKAGAAADIGPSVLQCAVTSAAALADGNAAAALLDRIAGDERLLRYWTFEITGGSAAKTFRRNMFPWTTVHDQPVFVAARERLEGVYEVTRQKIEQLLASVMP